jgi:hypothetical protein
MIVRIYSNHRLSKPATVVAAVAVLGAGFLLLTFGMVLLAAVAALGAGVAAASLVRRTLSEGRGGAQVAAPDPDRILLDPALEVTPRVEALKAKTSPTTPPQLP